VIYSCTWQDKGLSHPYFRGLSLRNYSIHLNLNKAKNNFDPRAPSNCKSLILSTDYNWVHSIDKFNFAKFTVKGGLKSF
jgi:hypothetical protein